MTYKLEEFKAWLAADPARKEGLDWNIFHYFHYWNQHPGYFESVFIPAVEADGKKGKHYSGEVYRPYRQIAKKWMAEVDTRERERERESKGGTH